MSTRATIQFKDKWDEFYVYSHCDGYPENILPEIEKVLEKKKDSWSGSECGTLVSCFLGENYDANSRLPNYEMTASFHGDESYRYFVEWNDDSKKWTVRVV